MNLRWLWLDHVPEEIVLSLHERKALRKVIERSSGDATSLKAIGTVFAGCAIAIAAFAIASWFAWFAAHRWDGDPALTLFITYPTLWVIFAAAYSRIARNRTLTALKQIGFDVCDHCGYWLRGLDNASSNCPECGHARTRHRAAPSPTAPESHQ